MTRSGAASIFVALGVASCGLVSGLDSLVVEDASPMDAASDMQTIDDALPPVDATTMDGGANDADASVTSYALSTGNGCASGDAAISMSGSDFSVEVWVRSTASTKTPETDGIVWNGGNGGEAGWAILSNLGAITFCAGQANNGQTCTSPPYLLPENDLVHIVATSTVVNLYRTLSLYVRDVTTNDATHTRVAQVATAPPTWSTTAPFTVGGIIMNDNCVDNVSAIIDDVRVFPAALTTVQMDTAVTTDGCDTGAIVDFEFNEGAGTTTTSCVNATSLTLRSATFVPSPFP